MNVWVGGGRSLQEEDWGTLCSRCRTYMMMIIIINGK